MSDPIADIREATLGPGPHLDKEGGHTHDPFADEAFLPPDSGLLIDPDGQYDEQVSLKLKGELAKREKCRRDMIAFSERFAPLISGEPYIAGWVHRDIARRIMLFMYAVERKERPALLLTADTAHEKLEFGVFGVDQSLATTFLQGLLDRALDGTSHLQRPGLEIRDLPHFDTEPNLAPAR